METINSATSIRVPWNKGKLIAGQFDSCGQFTSARSEFDRKKRISTRKARLHNGTRYHHPIGPL